MKLGLQDDLRTKNLINLFQNYKVIWIINTLITEDNLSLKRQKMHFLNLKSTIKSYKHKQSVANNQKSYYHLLFKVQGTSIQIILIHSMSSIIDNYVFIQDKHKTASNELVLSMETVAKDKNEYKIFKNQHTFQKLDKKLKGYYSLCYEGLIYIISIREYLNCNTLLSFECHQVIKQTYYSLNSSSKQIELMKSLFNYQYLYKSQPTYYLNQRRISLKLKIAFPEIDSYKDRHFTYFNQIVYNSIKSFHSLLLKIREADQSCLTKQYRNKQFAEEISIIAMMSRTSVYFSLHEENEENKQSLSHSKNQKAQLLKLKDCISQQSQLQRSISQFFVQSQKPAKSSWVSDNILYQGEMMLRKCRNKLVLSTKIQDKSDLKNFNQVTIEVKEKSSKPIAHGGSSHIYAIKVAISSVNGEILKKKVQKVMALKTLKPGVEVFLNRKFSREKQIVQKLDGAQNSFIPFYFNATNMLEEFKHSILMEYISGQQLDEFFRVRKLSVSLKTKVYLLLNILYGLLQLGERDIVHMDLKPINIMVCRGLVTKIIDFGQAFHREVCKTDYYPGFTFPYIAPEVYMNHLATAKRKKYMEFTPKQDVFAFGMIMYEVIFGIRMTQASPEKCKQIYVQREIKERQFQVPERLEDCGDWFIISSLRFIIDKCTEQNVDLRPNFNWIAIFLKAILNQGNKL